MGAKLYNLLTLLALWAFIAGGGYAVAALSYVWVVGYTHSPLPGIELAAYAWAVVSLALAVLFSWDLFED